MKDMKRNKIFLFSFMFFILFHVFLSKVSLPSLKSFMSLLSKFGPYTKREAPRFPEAPLFVPGVSRILFRRAC